MSGFRRVFVCRILGSHRWGRIEVEGEPGFECRDCQRRIIGDRLPEGDLRYLSGGGSSG
jgi:hypothetical protein